MTGFIFVLADAGASTGTSDSEMSQWAWLSIAAFLVILNGFFVAAEFALVKVRLSQIEKMMAENLPFAKSAHWLAIRMDHSLSACQLGITMASLALGYVGEPAFARLLEPIFNMVGVESKSTLHICSFVASFSVITSLHLVIGEQAPKIFAIRRPQSMVRWCAPLMVFFFYLLFPFMYVLNWATEVFLKMVGLTGGGSHGNVHTEDEIKAVLRESYFHQQLTDSEHSLLNRVFEFDDLLCREVMLPRTDVQILDINLPMNELLEIIQKTRHTRYPVCDGSLDSLLGVLHVKDLVGVDALQSEFDLRTILREVKKVPDGMPITLALNLIQKSRQLMTFVVDEHGLIVGVCTLENILEKIVGAVDDEFDSAETPPIQKVGECEYLVQGSALIREVERELDISMKIEGVDTMSGAVMERGEKVPEVGDKVEFDGAVAEVIEVSHDHAEQIRITLLNDSNS
ncbi:hemolysin family protein [Mariniblastus sp.]|jgi:CBS domain containing-hemolysin-like protein|nr:hemolysin family protein [Mariniblastus sp.]MDA7933004.1 hemolysin family protein [Mariniblastus sp.]